MTEWLRSIRPDQLESERAKATISLFPTIAVCSNSIFDTENSTLRRTVIEASYAYIHSVADASDLVRLADFVVWADEQRVAFDVLRNDQTQPLRDDQFYSFTLKYSRLLEVLSHIRLEGYQHDIFYGGLVSKADPRAGLLQAFQRFGESFTRQVFDSNPRNPKNTDDERQRFQGSVAFAAKFLGQAYFECVDLSKSLK